MLDMQIDLKIKMKKYFIWNQFEKWDAMKSSRKREGHKE
jgi:hypothetical protein